MAMFAGTKWRATGTKKPVGTPADTSFLTHLAEKWPPNCIKFRACSKLAATKRDKSHWNRIEIAAGLHARFEVATWRRQKSQWKSRQKLHQKSLV